MKNIIFDFDSTLISCESLEEIIKKSPHFDEKILAKVEKITNLGMEGKIDFFESLSERIKLIKLKKTDIYNFNQILSKYFTSDVKELLLWAKNHFNIYILSGGLIEVIEAFAVEFGINRENLGAVQLKWNENRAEVNSKDPFSIGKLFGAKRFFKNIKNDSIAIGDGFTDFQLFTEGIAQNFIAYTEHVERTFVKENQLDSVKSMKELQKKLEKFL